MSKTIITLIAFSLAAAPSALAKEKPQPNGNAHQNAGNPHQNAGNGGAQNTTAPATGTSSPQSAPVNQGDPDKVFQVSSSVQCDGTPVPGPKVEGSLGRTINVSGSPAIAYVSIKSGQGAYLVSSSFSGDFSTATVTISKDVSNYVIYSCAPPTASVPPTLVTPAPPVPPTLAPPTTPVPPVTTPTTPVPPVTTPPTPVPPVVSPPAATDLCKNIEGVQTKVPKGMTRKNGNCAKVQVKGKKKVVKVDRCKNIKGRQTKVPKGKVLKHGRCVNVAVKGQKKINVPKPKALPYTP